jgi:carbonic anhydrase
MVVCMDARLDTNELTGDTRKYYYVIRTAGSAIEDEEGDMLELAVANGVKLILLTTHSGCAAERAAADPAQRQRYPALTRSVLERGRRLRELLARPFLAAKIQSGELLVKQLDIDTRTELLLPH